MTTGRDTTLSTIISHPALTFCFISSRRIDSIFYQYDIIITTTTIIQSVTKLMWHHHQKG
jgi:hypothetical protein